MSVLSAESPTPDRPGMPDPLRTGSRDEPAGTARGDGHGHGPGLRPARQRQAAAPRTVRVRPSVLRLGIVVRLAIAGAAALLLWALVLGVAP